MSTNVVMPQLGESVVEGTVGKWFKQEGDHIDLYESIIEVVTDKVTTEIPSPAAGTVLQILVPEGKTVNAGTVLAVIGEPGEQPTADIQPQTSKAETHEPAAGERVAESAPTSANAERKKEPAEATPTTSTIVQESQRAPTAAAQAPAPASQQGPEKRDGGGATRLTPVVARMIGEYNITSDELQSIQGTGEGGRVSKKDIENFLKSRGEKKVGAPPTAERELAPWEQPGSGDLFKPTEDSIGKVTPRMKAAPTQPAPPAAQPQPEPRAAQSKEGDELVPLSQMRRAIAEHMVRSKQTAPHVTTIHEVDMTRVIEHMKAHQTEFSKQGAKLTYTPYFVQAVIAGLQAVPIVNAQFTDQGVLMKRALNIGIAVAIEEGLIVPVIKNADDKSLLGLARAVNDIATRARDKKLMPDDVAGGTFTITNYGIFGSLFGTPVINQPQSAILGVGAIQKRVVVIGGADSTADAIVIRPMVYLGLTFDHRLLDGAIGDQFMNKVKQVLENYQGM